MYPIIKQKIKDLSKEPVFLLIIGIEIAILIILIFFIHVKVEDGVVTHIQIFKSQIKEAGFFLNMVLPSFIGTIQMIVLFLMIIVLSGSINHTLKNPLSKIVLTKIPSRSHFLIANYIAINLFNIINLSIFLLLLVAVLFFKTGFFIITEPLLVGYDFVIVIISLTAIFTLFNMFIENETFISVVGLFLCFYLGARLGGQIDTDNILKLILGNALPPLYYIRGFDSILNHNLVNLKTIGFSFGYVLMYLLISAIIYKRRDLN
ncbi:MAG: hypothetical protein QME58_09045 [Bacteroidota bacterium]|nr:hypothetical protein [Bacteroidota bacterium]